MIVYTVHEPGRPASTLEERAENVVFIKEGFTLIGFLIAPFWLLANRLWLEFIAVVGFVVLAILGLKQLGIDPVQAGNSLSLLLSLIVGYEGNNLRRWRLERKGYVLLGTIVGRDFVECERRFFDMWLPQIAERGSASRISPVMNLKASPPPPSPDWRGPATIGTLPGSM